MRPLPRGVLDGHQGISASGCFVSAGQRNRPIGAAISSLGSTSACRVNRDSRPTGGSYSHRRDRTATVLRPLSIANSDIGILHTADNISGFLENRDRRPTDESSGCRLDRNSERLPLRCWRGRSRTQRTWLSCGSPLRRSTAHRGSSMRPSERGVLDGHQESRAGGVLSRAGSAEPIDGVNRGGRTRRRDRTSPAPVRRAS
jgi:hypothetical protein